MERVEAMHSSRRRNGPALRGALHVIGQTLGIDWAALRAPSFPDPETPQGPTIAELAATARPLL